MIPFKDDNPTRVFPFVTIGLLTANAAVFILQLLHPSDPGNIVFSFGAVPRFLLTFTSSQPIHPFLTIITSMFMHGNLLHFGSNMLFLWIFGDNVEDRLGHFRFLVFYILCGVVSVYSHAITEPASMLPMIGASGAVSGVLGAYMVLYPRARVHTLIFFGFFVQIVRLPALIVIGIWIVIQFLNGLLSRGETGLSGVAWFAHIGGFVFGVLMILLFFKKKKRRY
jgi:membrane associated rhomboid family serine protease